MNTIDLAADRLKRELERSAEMAGCSIDFMSEQSKVIDSSPFAGTGEHDLVILVHGDANQAWTDTLDENALYLPGFVLDVLSVADIQPFDGALAVGLWAVTVKEA